MSVSPTEILDVARKLSGGGFEPEFRSAISRAYYAAYHRVVEVTPDCFANDDLAPGSSHDKVIRSVTAFGKSLTPGRTEAARIARALPALKLLRVKADYRIADSVLEGEAASAIASAERIMSYAADIARKASAPAAPAAAI